MTSIKPPTGPHTGPIPAALEPRESGHGADPVVGPGATRVQGPQLSTASSAPSASVAGLEAVAGAAGAQTAPAAAGPGALSALAQAVERGQLSMTQAVDQLVERTVGGMRGQLTELERSELSALLRQAAQDDPALRALRDEQG
jgi:hypothetical protein